MEKPYFLQSIRPISFNKFQGSFEIEVTFQKSSFPVQVKAGRHSFVNDLFRIICFHHDVTDVWELIPAVVRIRDENQSVAGDVVNQKTTRLLDIMLDFERSNKPGTYLSGDSIFQGIEPVAV